MPLIVIGELTTKLDTKTNHTLLEKYPEIPWRAVKDTRNKIAHDYFSVDAREIFDTCKNDIPELSRTIKKIITDIQNYQY